MATGYVQNAPGIRHTGPSSRSVSRASMPGGANESPNSRSVHIHSVQIVLLGQVGEQCVLEYSADVRWVGKIIKIDGGTARMHFNGWHKRHDLDIPRNLLRCERPLASKAYSDHQHGASNRLLGTLSINQVLVVLGAGTFRRKRFSTEQCARGYSHPRRRRSAWRG